MHAWEDNNKYIFIEKLKIGVTILDEMKLKKISHVGVVVSSCALLQVALLPMPLTAGCMNEQTDAEAFDQNMAVAEVEVLSAEPFFTETGKINTGLILRPVEVFKGELPESLEITVSGGTIGKQTDYGSETLPLKAGKSYVLMLNQDARGNWSAAPSYAFRVSANPDGLTKFFRNRARGERPDSTSSNEEVAVRGTGFDQSNNGIPGSVVTTTGYSEDVNGHPARFTAGDADEPIPYLVDVDPSKLPPGMDEAAAIAAVEEAFDAWSASSSLRFRYDGAESFGQGADTIAVSDRRLRIQLHDNFGSINTTGILGIGGGSFTSNASVFFGGTIGGQGFQERKRGYVVIETSPMITEVAKFKRVLTHEIGHALGLAHSSENPSEPDAILKDATMYFQTPSGTTGATIQDYDVDRIQFGYPETETPPYSTDRIMRVVTTDPFFGTFPTGVLGVNSIELQAVNRQGGVLTPTILSSTSVGGTFSLSGSVLSYTPSGFFEAYLDNTQEAIDDQIEAGFSFDSANIEFTDSEGLKRVVKCSVISLEADRTPSDGLPDNWMVEHFGSNAVGALDSGKHPDDDPDGDGLSNRVEFYINTNPNLASSGPVTPTYNHETREFVYTPVRFAPYRIESAVTLENGAFAVRKITTQFQSDVDIKSDFSSSAAPDREFYRAVTGP